MSILEHVRDRDMIDSRDLIELREDARLNLDSEDDEERAEAIRMVEAIDALEPECGEDFPYGEALIHEDYFRTYAEQLAEDIGSISPETSWPLSYIDWDAAADALKADYATVEIDGQTYYTRA